MTLLWKKDSFLSIAAYTSDAALEERRLSGYSGVH